MEYPEEFSSQARARVEAERLRARRDLEGYRNRPETRPRRRHSSGPYGTLWTDDEEDVHEYILRVFLVFGLRACELGLQGLWTVDRIRTESAEFLRRFTIEAFSEKGHDKSGHELTEMTSRWDGSILQEVQREFEKSDQWHQFETELLDVAERQAQSISKLEGAMNLPELPPKFQDCFEAAKAKAELEYATRFARFPHYSPLTESLHHIKRIQDVLFAYCKEARNACREGNWTAAQVRLATEAAVPMISDFYFVREHENASDAQRSAFRVASWRTVNDDSQWKQHLSELAALAGGVSIGSRAVSGGNRDKNPSVTNWDAIQISFLSEFKIQITAGDHTYPQNYGEMGFADGRTKNGHPKPNRAWQIFRALAESGGTIRDTPKAEKDWPKLEKRMQEIRRILRNHFGIPADLLPFVAGTGYRAVFKISCNPSFHT